MPVRDAPYWRMNPKTIQAIEEVAPAQRVFLRSLLDTLENVEAVDWNDRLSFGAEVLAAQVNLLADMCQKRREDLSPERQLGHSGYVNVIVSDIMERAILRRMRGEDR